MPWTDDPVADYNRHCDEQERQMAKLPKCDCCGYRVTDETYYDINGEILCEECLNDKYRKYTDDFMN